MEPGQFYHIYNRGNNREIIFKEEKNYYYFMTNFNKYVNNIVDTFSYCLMPNHFHFLVRIKDIENNKTKGGLTFIDKCFRDFFITYAKAINNNYNRTGALFQQKFKKKLNY